MGILPGTRAGPGFRDQTLAVKNRKNARKSFFLIKNKLPKKLFKEKSKWKQWPASPSLKSPGPVLIQDIRPSPDFKKDARMQARLEEPYYINLV